ncbi:hypothetical protein [Streptomyces sp. NPDC050145]|uniref:hypothetical protein n=1 Tax=Streptomyces sp. NPDC050145 TaxID=3365602 RepID=UPI0037A84AF4
MLSGLFDEHPNLQIILGHLGEGLPLLLPRLEHRLPWCPAMRRSRSPAATAPVSSPPTAALCTTVTYDAVFGTFGAFVIEAVADGGRYALVATCLSVACLPEPRMLVFCRAACQERNTLLF